MIGYYKALSNYSQLVSRHLFAKNKAKNARKFIESGNKLKITVRFRGREINNSKAGETDLNRFIEELSDISVVEKAPKLEGRNMFIMLAKKA